METYAATDILDGGYHGLSGFGVKEVWWSQNRLVSEIRKVFPFLVFPYLFFIILDSNKDI